MCRSVSQAFSDPSQAPLSRLKQQAQGEIGKIRVRSTATGFVRREGLGCEARPLDLFKSSQDTTRASWELRGTPGDEAEKKQRCFLPYTDPYTYIYICMSLRRLFSLKRSHHRDYLFIALKLCSFCAFLLDEVQMQEERNSSSCSFWILSIVSWLTITSHPWS